MTDVIEMLLLAFLLTGCLASLAHGTKTDCMKEVYKCSKMYRSLSANTVLLDSKFSLQDECKLQERFFSCLAYVAPICLRERQEFSVPYYYLRKLDAVRQLCTDGTHINKRYKAEYVCVLLQNVSYCSSEEFLGANLLDQTSPERFCWLTLESRRCIIDSLKRYCGVEAGNLYKEINTLFVADDDCAQPLVSGETTRNYARTESQLSSAQSNDRTDSILERASDVDGSTESRASFQEDSKESEYVESSTLDSGLTDKFTPAESSSEISDHSYVVDNQPYVDLAETSSVPTLLKAQLTQRLETVENELEPFQEQGDADPLPFASEESESSVPLGESSGESSNLPSVGGNLNFEENNSPPEDTTRPLETARKHNFMRFG